MFNAGLVSISFRCLSPEEVIREAAKAGLGYIEWGSDVHAPCNDKDRLKDIAKLQNRYGVKCCAYGTYFRLGVTPMEELPEYISAAKLLGTDILRLWCGTKQQMEYTPEEKDYLLDQCKQAAKIAEKFGVILCLECHRNTYTQTWEGALELMESVKSPAFRMYWQPNQDRSVEENLRYIRLIKDYVRHIHTFHWKGTDKFPLEDGLAEWKRYVQEFSGDHLLLLEFMPDGRIESLAYEAATLRKLIGE